MILTRETYALKDPVFGLDEGADWRRNLMAELRIVVEESHALSAARPVKLAASTLRRKLRAAGVDVPSSGGIDSAQWRRFATALRGEQRAGFVETIPQVLAYNATIGRSVAPRSHRGFRVAYLREVHEALTSHANLIESAHDHLRAGLADVLTRWHARLARMRKRAAESGSFYGRSAPSDNLDIEGPCSVLGITVPGAGEPVDETVLASAYKHRAVACHPDRHGGDPERAAELLGVNLARDSIQQYNLQVRPAGS